MLIDNTLFAVFSENEKLWPYRLENILYICEQISKFPCKADINSLPQEYIRSLCKVVRHFELEGEFQVSGLKDSEQRVKLALPLIKDAVCNSSIGAYQFSIDDFQKESENLLNKVIDAMTACPRKDVICIEYSLYSDLLMSSSDVVIYSLSSLKNHATYLADKSIIYESQGRSGMAKKCRALADELMLKSPCVLLENGGYLNYGEQQRICDLHDSLNNIWPILETESLWTVCDNKDVINDVLFSVIEGFQSKIFGSWCHDDCVLKVNGFNESRNIKA